MKIYLWFTDIHDKEEFNFLLEDAHKTEQLGLKVPRGLTDKLLMEDNKDFLFSWYYYRTRYFKGIEIKETYLENLVLFQINIFRTIL